MKLHKICLRANGKLKTFMLILVATGVAACGGGKKDRDLSDLDSQSANIDQLLGIESNTTDSTQAAVPSADKGGEDEVLKLLGITKDDSRSSKGAVPASMEMNEVETLRAEVDKLRTELFEKDNVIQNLRNDLDSKDRRLAELQTASLASDVVSQPGAGRRTTPAGTNATKARYEEGLAAYNARRYKQAIEIFSELLAGDISASLADNCQYWIGESYYGLGNYAQAIAEFEKVFRYPNTNKADAALLKLGITYLKLDDRNSARTQFELLIANHPKSEYIERARQYLNNL